MHEVLALFSDDSALRWATFIIRFLLPALALIVIIRCVKSLFYEKSEAETWGHLSLPNGAKVSLNHWENIIGRDKDADVYLEYPTVSRNHAAVIRDGKGNWRAYDVQSRDGVTVNGKKIESRDGLPIKEGDELTLGGVNLYFFPFNKFREYKQVTERTKAGVQYKTRNTLIFLTEFQLLLGLQLCISKGEDLTIMLPLSFVFLIGLMWACFMISRLMQRTAFEIETLAFFLTTIGMAVTATSAVHDISRQVLILIGGLILYYAIGLLLRNLSLTKQVRWIIAIVGVLLLAINILFAEEQFGARRWIEIAGISFQPAEFVKIAFIFVGAATMERMFARRNLLVFIAFTGVCLLSMAIIVDFGTAMVFFMTYLVIAFLRSGDLATILLSIGGAGFASFIALRFWPHIANRFSTWGRAWDYVDTGGFQQIHAMAAVAGGGLLGVGAGNGWFHGIVAANSDLVFALVAEELGLIMAIFAVSAVVILVVFSVYSTSMARSSFYVIGACAVSTVLVFQMLLNVLGSLDILPFTGITFPFVSRGGTSLVVSWALLAFIQAADTRQNASYITKSPEPPITSGHLPVITEFVEGGRNSEKN